MHPNSKHRRTSSPQTALSLHTLGRLVLLGLCLTPWRGDARLGDSTTEVAKRYGTTTAQLEDGSLSYRTYQFKGCEVEVFLENDASVVEFINFKPREVLGRERARKVVEDMKTLVDGILSAAYTFPAEEIDAFWQSLGPVSREQTENAEVTHYRAARRIGEVDVAVILDESQISDFVNTIRFEGYLSLRKAQGISDELGERIQKLLNAAARQKQAQQQNAAAEGF